MEDTESDKSGGLEKAANEKAKRQFTRVYSKYILPSDRHSFPTHFDILRRFVTLSRAGNEPISAPKVEGEGVPVQAAEMNVRFLKSIGLLTTRDRGMYVPTAEAIKFVNAKTVSDERAKPLLKALITDSWFAETGRSVLGAHPFMSEEQFLGELALAAETDKSRKEPALQVLADYLVYTGIVNRDERGLSLGDGGPAQAQAITASGPQPELGASKAVAGEVAGWHTVQTEDFYLRIRSEADALSDLRAHLEILERKVTRLKQREAVPTP